MEPQSDLLFLTLGLAKQAAAEARSQLVHSRAQQRRGEIPKPRRVPGSDFPLIEDSPGQVNPIAAGIRSLHTGAKPGLAQFQGNLGFLNPVVDMAWNMTAPPGNRLQGQSPYSQSPWMHNIPEIYRQGAQVSENAMRSFQPYENGLDPSIAPWFALAQQYAPQLMSKMGSVSVPIGFMF